MISLATSPPSVASLEAEAVELGLPCYSAHPVKGRRVHLGRGHMTLMARRVRGVHMHVACSDCATSLHRVLAAAPPPSCARIT